MKLNISIKNFPVLCLLDTEQDTRDRKHAVLEKLSRASFDHSSKIP